MTEIKNGGNSALALFGDREEVREVGARLEMLLPSVKECGPSGALALAQVAVSMGLNPFLGEVWLIPKKNRAGEVVGFSVMAGIKGLRRAARRQVKSDGGYFTPPRFRLPTEEEIPGVVVRPGDIAVACDIEIWTAQTAKVFAATGRPVIVSGIGIFRKAENTRMEPIFAARKRAEADAIKQAFDLPFGVGDPVLSGGITAGDWTVERRPALAEPVDESMAVLYGGASNGDTPMLAEGATVEPEPIDAGEAEPVDEQQAETIDFGGAESEPLTEVWFVEYVARQVVYYTDAEHVRRAMRQLELLFDPTATDKLYEALEKAAHRRANERAAAADPWLETAAEQETFGF